MLLKSDNLINICILLSLLLSLSAQLEDCTFQLYKCQNPAKNKVEADYYGNYLDLESTIDELQEEFEGFHTKWVYACFFSWSVQFAV